jgi:very-short-patch-repair endonuclease
VVEVDGPIHDYTPEEDAIRQAFIEWLGFRVIRFTNAQVFDSLPEVLASIAQALSGTDSPASDSGP